MARILVVEKEEDFRLVLATMLKEESFGFCGLINTGSALDRLRT